jgi:hypothetical protein
VDINMNSDVIVACADLVGRTGASDFEIGYVHDNVPVEEAGWYAHVKFRGVRIMVDDHRSPSAAALALAEKILTGGACRCGQTVTLSDDKPGCRWRLMGKRWEPGCDVEPIHVKGDPGDRAAMVKAYHEQVGNRAQRRAAKKNTWSE